MHRSFFPTVAEGVGALNYDKQTREKLALESHVYTNPKLGKSNIELLPDCFDNEEEDNVIPNVAPGVVLPPGTQIPPPKTVESSVTPTPTGSVTPLQ